MHENPSIRQKPNGKHKYKRFAAWWSRTNRLSISLAFNLNDIGLKSIIGLDSIFLLLIFYEKKKNVTPKTEKKKKIFISNKKMHRVKKKTFLFTLYIRFRIFDPYTVYLIFGASIKSTRPIKIRFIRFLSKDKHHIKKNHRNEKDDIIIQKCIQFEFEYWTKLDIWLNVLIK